VSLISVPGSKLFAKVDGGGEKPWIVISNSLAADHTMWDRQIDLLTQKYRVLRYDTRGHGKSEAPEGPYSFDMLASDAIALMDYHSIRKATFMGLSLGGATALAAGLKRPDRFERIVCCDVRADAPEPFLKGWAEREAAVDKDGIQAVVEGNLERWLVKSYRDANPDVVKETTEMILRTSATGWKGCVGALRGLDLLRQLPDMKPPTVYVLGAEDMGAPYDAMKAMTAATPGAWLAIIPNAAHFPNVDNTPAFNAALASILGI